MATQLLLKESTQAIVKKGRRWRVVVATPGTGTSGKYSENVLREYGPSALPPRSKAFFDHDPKRSIKDMVGYYPDGAYWDDTLKELVAELQPFEHWQSVVDEIGPFAEASIYMMGEKDDDGNVTKLLPHRTNGVDLVGYGGLEGAGLKEQVESLFETARALDSGNTPPEFSRGNEKKEVKMDKELIEAFDGLTKLLTPVVTYIAESQTAAKGESQVKVDAEAIAEANKLAVTEYDEKVKAIDAAKDLLPSQRESLREAAKAGAVITDALANAVKVVEEFKAQGTSTTVTETVAVGGQRIEENWDMPGVNF